MTNKPDIISTSGDQLAQQFIDWVERYAAKTCPPGCLPSPAQEREIRLFAAVVCVLLEREYDDEHSDDGF